jgi:16S rRNA (guanine966-N2)-methyltransferase
MKRASGKLRIIGGAFRSRVVEFDAAPGVRATPDRVRQTLFDWLTPVIEGARCVDLFAGSGALGLEALSRGAAHVTFVETGAAQAAAIRAALATLKVGDRATVVQGDALGFLSLDTRPAAATRDERFEIAFLDPPFDAGLLVPALAALPRALSADPRVYAEWHRTGALPWPAGYSVLREKKAGQVSYALATYAGEKRGETSA